MTSPPRRALLISSPRGGLAATGPSLARMREFLVGQGFVVGDEHCLHGEQATRAAIVAGMTALVDATGPGDVVVFYYAGHGGVFRDVVGPVCEPHPVLEPIDLADSDTGHFNGLLGSELRLFTRALARVCDNVTAIFDCCHAAGLVDTDRPAADTDDTADREAIAAIARRAGERLAELRRQQTSEPHRSDHDAPPAGIVRLIASSATERAYAHPGRPLLLFTDTLVAVLEQYALAARMTWEQILRDVRARVQEVRPEQRPGVEGARERLPFSRESRPTPRDYFHVRRSGAQLMLAAGSVAGLRRDHAFDLLPYTDPDGPALGTARPIQIAPFHAVLERPRGAPPTPRVLFARRVRDGEPELAARLVTRDDPDERARASALTAAARARLLEPATGDTPPGHVDLLDCLHSTPQRVARLAFADPATPDELARALRRLERWAGLAARLGDPGLGPIGGCYVLEWGIADGDDIRPLAPHGPVQPGEQLVVRMDNPGRLAALHFQVFRVRADRCVDPWRDADGGLGVLSGHRVTVRERFTPLSGLPGLQHEWLVVALGDGALDLAGLATPAADRPRTRAGDATRVEIVGLPYILA